MYQTSRISVAGQRNLQDNASSARQASTRSLSASDPGRGRCYSPSLSGRKLVEQVESDMPDRGSRVNWQYSDSHFHPTDYVQQGHKLTDLIAYMDALGIRYTTLMPIPTNVLSSHPDPSWNPCAGERHCGPHYYLPQQMLGKRSLSQEDMQEARAATELYVNTEVDAITAMQYRKLPQAHRQRLDPMITGLHLGDMHSSTYLLRKLAQYPGVFTGVGEITVYKEVVQDLFAGTRQANLGRNAEPLLKLLQTCGQIGMPVVLHCDVDLPGREDSQAPAYLDEIRSLFRNPAVSNTVIIWAHAGGLGRFVNAPAGHATALRDLLDDNAMKHVHIDLSWTVVADRLTQSPQTQAEWTQLIMAHPHRFLFGSDALAPASGEAWNKTYASYAGLLATLPETVRRQVTTGNYQRLFVKARSKVRAYETFFLASAMRELERFPALGAPPATITATPGKAGMPADADYGKGVRPDAAERQGSPSALRH